MRVLALDTTTHRGSAGLVENDRVLVEREGDASRTHAQRLPRELLDVLDAARVPLADVDAFAVAVGPGSFTGLRIGIAAIQGLALVTGRQVLAVSILEALGHLASLSRAPGEHVGVWVDARRGDVYSALYRVDDAAPFSLSRLVEVDPPRVGPPADVMTDWLRQHGEVPLLVGDGAIVHAATAGGTPTQAPPPLAGAIGRIAVARFHAGLGQPPSTVQPLYVRRPDVEVAREQKRDA